MEKAGQIPTTKFATKHLKGVSYPLFSCLAARRLKKYPPPLPPPARHKPFPSLTYITGTSTKQNKMGNKNQVVSFKSAVFSHVQEHSGHLDGDSKPEGQCAEECGISSPTHLASTTTRNDDAEPDAAMIPSGNKDSPTLTPTQFVKRLDSVTDTTPISGKKRRRAENTAGIKKKGNKEGRPDYRMNAAQIASSGVLAECSECHANIGTTIDMAPASDPSDSQIDVQSDGMVASSPW